jgi:tetratricopeptide (TPR) repeat protein
MASVFLSYDHEDSARAAPLAAALETSGHSVWWDRQIHGGAEYNSAIEDAVERSDAVIVLWSQKSVHSAWVRDEAAEGRDAGKLVPVLIDAVKPPMGFRQYQTIDLAGWSGGKRIPRLADILQAIDKLTIAAPAVETHATQAPPPPKPKPRAAAGASKPVMSRRVVLGSGAAVAIAGLAGGGIWWANREPSDPRFQALIDEGEEAVRHQTVDAQTVRALESAVAMRPGSAKALGLSALVKSLVQVGNPEDFAKMVPDAERAARQALAIDPRQPDALLAMFELQGSALDWFTRDQKLRQVIAIDPKSVGAISELILLLQATGYVRESWDWNERVIDLEPLSADFLGRRAFKLWIRGQVPAADKVADQLRALYPTDPWAFYVRFKIYAFTGRAKAALAMLNGDPTLGGRPALARFWRACLEALDQRSPETIAKARQASIDGARTSPQMATEGLQVMGALGEIDTAFELAEGVLLQRGPLVQQVQGGSADAVNAATWRVGTQWMFTPPADPMRADPRFLVLCDGVGLTDYWRKRGVKPDYQRA